MYIFRLIVFTFLVSAQIALPPNDGFFTETVDLVEEEQEVLLEKALSDIADSTGQYIIVLFLDGFYGDDPAEIAAQVHEEWNIPKTSVVLLFGYKDRQSHIEAGTAVRELFEDVVTKGIVEKDILPLMREGEYAKAVLEGVESIMKHLAGQYSADRYADDGTVPKSLLIILLYATVVLFGISWLFGTIIVFKTDYKYTFAGTVLGPVVGVLLLEKYGLWLSIPPFLILGVVFDVLVYKMYRSFMSQKRKRSRRH